MTAQTAGLATRVLRWQRRHGRHHLPWQDTSDTYRVWLSEVMLQQTQVATVVDYFARFVARFPDVQALAGASLDQVMGLWSGLGYYSRARNLHRCARAVVARFDGVFPRDAQALATLPGVGRSTAAAIASLCFGERVAVLDANIRRVLTRVLAFDADLTRSANQELLWQHADGFLPRRNLAQTMPRYTQGMMDLGATVCLARQPLCARCPLIDLCKGCATGSPLDYPAPARKRKRSAQSIWLLWAHDGKQAVWLQRRPAPGVWAGLYCLPCFDERQALLASVPARYRGALHDLDAFKHVLTHKDLHLHLVRVRLSACAQVDAAGQWFASEAWQQLGLPAPVRRVLLQG